MAKITGAGGNFSGPTGFNAAWETWEAEFNFGPVDTTAFEDDGYTNSEATICSLTGTATGTGMYDAASTSPISSTALASSFAPSATSGSFTLTAQTGCTYAFTGHYTSVRQARSAKQGNKHDITYQFTNQGAITQTWDQTS